MNLSKDSYHSFSSGHLDTSSPKKKRLARSEGVEEGEIIEKISAKSSKALASKDRARHAGSKKTSSSPGHLYAEISPENSNTAGCPDTELACPGKGKAVQNGGALRSEARFNNPGDYNKSATISKPPNDPEEDLYRSVNSRDFSSSKSASRVNRNSFSEDRGESIEIHACPDDDIEKGDPHDPGDSDMLPFSDQQLLLLKRVISDSIEQKMKDFQVPSLNDTMHDVCQSLAGQHSSPTRGRPRHRSTDFETSLLQITLTF